MRNICLPFGFNAAPYVFMKIMKSVITRSREQGYFSVIYIDHFLSLEYLGFVLNMEKSSLVSAQKQKFLGFVLNFIDMIIELPENKRSKSLNLLHKFKFKVNLV